MRSPFLTLAVAVVSAHAVAAEVSIYDCDYSDDAARLGMGVALSGDPFPNRTEASSIPFGEATVGNAPEPWTGTAAILHPGLTGSMLHYSQLEFRMITGSVYAFRKHRIELVFRFLDQGASGADEAMTISTDGGLAYRLDLSGDGGIGLISGVLEHDPVWGDRVVTQYDPAGSFDPAQPVHVILETDINLRTATVTVNGQARQFTERYPQLGGFRNMVGYPGPVSVRVNFSASSGTTTLALRKVKITGDDYDGPLFHYDTPSEPTEVDVVTVPFEAPQSGTWQPEFSMDGTKWTSCGGTMAVYSPIHAVSFGRLVSPTMFFRVRKVAD